MSKEFNDRLKQIRKAADKKNNPNLDLYTAPKADLVDTFLNSESKNKVIDNFITETKTKYDVELNPEVNDKEIKELLDAIGTRYDAQRLNVLIDDCKSSVLDSIIKPFGIAGFLFEDKLGGNVDTIHNVRNTDERYNNGQGIYATEENKKRYDERPEYKYIDYHDDNENYKKHREDIINSKKNNETIIDAYTNLEIGNDDVVSIEHIISASDVSKDPAVILARANGAEIANDNSNLCNINGQLNSSIKTDSPSEYLDKMKRLKNPEARQNLLNYLNSKSELTPEEQKAKKLLEQKNAMVENEEEVQELGRKARQEMDKKLNEKYYTSKEFAKNLGITGAKEGLKMGTQQAIGLMVREFTLAVFSEAEDIFSKRHNIKLNNEFIKSLKERFERISKRILSKWKDVVAAFGSGVVSGFFSNIITVIINSFLTTSKRAVKIIREGFYSLLKALKMLFFLPENMTKEEAAHEATKLISSGLIVAGGVALEEILQKALESVPIIGFFADEIATVILGIVTGLSIAFVVYIIDKIDLFKVNQNNQLEYISKELDGMIDNDIEEFEDAYKYIATTLGV